MTDHPRLPRWLKSMNCLLIGLQRRGLAVGPTRLLSVPGRTTGNLRTAPVSTLTIAGHRYIVAALEGVDWVANARAAGWGNLARGRAEERVAQVELPQNERGPILREFPRLIPGGVSFFRRLCDLPDDKAALPDAFAMLAPHCPVFRIEPPGFDHAARKAA